MSKTAKPFLPEDGIFPWTAVSFSLFFPLFPFPFYAFVSLSFFFFLSFSGFLSYSYLSLFCLSAFIYYILAQTARYRLVHEYSNVGIGRDSCDVLSHRLGLDSESTSLLSSAFRFSEMEAMCFSCSCALFYSLCVFKSFESPLSVLFRMMCFYLASLVSGADNREEGLLFSFYELLLSPHKKDAHVTVYVFPRQRIDFCPVGARDPTTDRMSSPSLQKCTCSVERYTAILSISPL